MDILVVAFRVGIGGLICPTVALIVAVALVGEICVAAVAHTYWLRAYVEQQIRVLGTSTTHNLATTSAMMLQPVTFNK